MTTTRNAAPRPMMTIVAISVAHADHAHTRLSGRPDAGHRGIRATPRGRPRSAIGRIEAGGTRMESGVSLFSPG